MKADSPKSDYEAFTRGLDVSGIKGLRRIVMSAGFNKDEWQSRLFLDAPAPRKGLLKLLEPTPIDPALAGRIPPDAVSAAVMQFDFAALLATARELLTAIDPKTAREFNKGVGGLGMSIGRRIDTEILGPLGSQWAIFASPSTGGNGPMGLVAANKLGDAKVAKAAWTDLYNALANVLPKQLKQKGVTVTPAADNQAVAGTSLYSFKIDRVPVTPCFVINGDYIYFGVDPAVVAKAAAAEWPRRDGSAPYELQAAIMEVPRYTSFRYTDLAKTAPVILGSADTFWPMLVGPAADQGITLPKQLFPPADQIGGMLTPAGTYSWADDRGFHSRSRLPFPGAGMLGYLQGDETTLAVVGVGALGVSVPAMIKAREQANRVAAASSLRQISQGIHLHAAERDGMPPADLGALVTAKYFPTAKLFVSPASDTGVPPEIENGTPEQVAAWVKANSDFVYIKPPDKLAKVKNPSGVPIAYEKIGIHGIEGTNVGFVDGHVEWMSVPAATMLIRQTTGGDPVKYEPAK
jgi:prepilin-type processing-associated H-X9-DG protein